MMSFFVIILPLLTIVGWIVYENSAASITQITSQYSSQITSQVSQNIEQYVLGMDDLAATLYWDPDVRRFLREPDPKPLDLSRVQNWLATVPKIRSGIRAIYVFGKDDRVLMKPGGEPLKPWLKIPEMPWYQSAVLAQGQSVVSSSHVQNLFLNQYPWVVSLSRAITDYKTGEVLGVILIDLNFEVINNICNRITLGSRGYVFILDHVGSFVYHPQQQLVYNGLKTENVERILHTDKGMFIDSDQNEERFVTVCTSAATGWRIVGVGYARDLLAATNNLRNTVILACVIALLAGLGVSVFLTSRITNPIRRLEDSMRRVEAGELGITVPVTSQYEIASLEQAFNLMSQKTHDLLEQTHREQEAKRKNELRVLQAQINPHFLYNTLDSVVWMAEGGRLADVVLMVSALAKLFRKALSSGRDLIPLADEIEHVYNYLIIQKIRYGDCFDYRIDVDPDVLQVQTLKLILQPLVENAIVHGVKPLGEGGMITVQGYVNDQNLILEVRDNGVGMTPDRLANWRQRSRTSKSGVGLINVEERIHLFFGDKFGLTIESECDEGTKITVTLPFQLTESSTGTINS